MSLGPDAVPQVFERAAAPGARSSGARSARRRRRRSSISVAARATSRRFSRERWPRARIVGVDNSKEMLAKARASAGGRRDARMDRRRHRDAVRRREPIDVVYSNAALHWQDDHAQLFPRIFDWVAPGGVLAVQMPDQFAAPSHVAVAEVVAAARVARSAGAAAARGAGAAGGRLFSAACRRRPRSAWTRGRPTICTSCRRRTTACIRSSRGSKGRP